MSTETLLPKLAALTINQNKDGWGPSDIPEEFKNMPYQPFSKDTRLGKIADWSGSVYQDMKSKNRYTSQFGGGGQYAYYHDDDDVNFLTAGAAKSKTAPQMRNRQRLLLQRKQRGAMPYQQTRQQGPWQQGAQQIKARPNMQNYRKPNVRQDNRNKPRVIREPSIPIQDHWLTIDEIDLSRLTALSLPNRSKPMGLADFGELGYFDSSLENVNTKDQVPLGADDVTMKLTYLPILHDSVMTELMSSKLGNVFMSTQVAAFLMCAPRSVYSWDLVAYKEDDVLIIDFRDKYESPNIELNTMNENAQEPPPDNLAKIYILEGVLCTQYFRRRILNNDSKAPKYSFPNSIPDEEDEDEGPKQPQSFGYRYRLFDIGNDINVVIRCEVDAAVKGKKKTDVKFACVYPLTECPTKAPGAVDWRSKLDTQAGAVLASELRNNSFKLARFTTRALLAGAEFVKLGFISRVNPKDHSKHTILGIQQFKTSEFAQQIGYNSDNAWGILRCIIEHFKKMPDGAYLIQKDANKPVLRFHTVPNIEVDEEIVAADDEQIKTTKEKLLKEAQERLENINKVLGNSKLGTI